MTSAASNSTVAALDNVLHKKPTTLLPDELAYLISAFTPSQADDVRSKAYLVLSALCQGARSSQPPQTSKEPPDPKDDPLVKVFSPIVTTRITSEEADPLLEGITFLTALFQVDWQSASVIFIQDGILTCIMDSVELNPPPTLSLAVASLLGQAIGHKSCRSVIDSQAVQWLEAQARQTRDTALRAAAVVALVKMTKGAATDNLAAGADGPTANEDEKLAKIMKGMVIDNSDASSMTNTIEGLAYVSNNPVIKEMLSMDKEFLSSLFSLVPKRKPNLTSSTPISSPSSLIFGILVVVSNICSHRPRLTEEQAQIDKLKRMAQAGKKQDPSASESEKLDDDEYVNKRIRRLVSSSLLEMLTSAVAVAGVDSLGVRTQAGRIFLDVLEDKENRGRALQAGASKSLQLIIKSGFTDSKGTLDPAYLAPIQALAKLSITSSPLHVFGPNSGTIIDAIRPFSTLLLHDSSTLLQRFESIMALTNLSSQSPEVGSRIAKTEGLMNKLELLLLEDHTLIRRAAMELICNLIGGSEEVFERYSANKSKIQVVLALSDVDDLPTRLAASGALAVLTSTPSACKVLLDLQIERNRVLPILVELMDPNAGPATAGTGEEDGERDSPEWNPGLRHRGIVCACNFVLSIEDSAAKKTVSKQAEEAGLLVALASIIKSDAGEEILMPAKELLQFMVRERQSLN